MHVSAPITANATQPVASPGSEIALNGVMLEMMKMSQARMDYDAAAALCGQSIQLLDTAAKTTTSQ